MPVKNTTKEKMEMTTPVYTRKVQSDGEKMEMTTPVITKRVTLMRSSNFNVIWHHVYFVDDSN